MGGIHRITVRQALGALSVVAVLLLPFGIKSCAQGMLHIPLFPMKMDAGAMQQCSANLLVHLQQLDQLLGSLALSDALLFVVFCALLCMARERKRARTVVSDAALRIRLYLKKIRSLLTLHLPFLSYERIALPGLMPYKHPALS